MLINTFKFIIKYICIINVYIYINIVMCEKGFYIVTLSSIVYIFSSTYKLQLFNKINKYK